LFTHQKIAVIVDHSWAMITAKSAHGVARTSLRRLGHPAWALDWVPRIIFVFFLFSSVTIPSFHPWMPIFAGIFDNKILTIWKFPWHVSNPLHRYEFGPPKFFFKSFKFPIIFYSTWQISGGGQCRKACRSRKKESKQLEITWKQSNVFEVFLRSKKEENVYGHCDMNNAQRILSKGSTLLRGCWFWSKKLHFQKNFGRNFIAVEGVTYHLDIHILRFGSTRLNSGKGLSENLTLISPVTVFSVMPWQ